MGFLEERDLTAVPTIPEFYKGKTIFITGGSGLMGKVLIEKLLYSCPDLDRIYLLLRNKKGVKSEDRLRELYSCACFDRLRESKENPTILESKVFAVAGDVTEEGLGLSDDDRTLLVNRVNIIFHIAASVRFNDSLKFAVDMNLRGTKRVVELAEEIRNLSVFLHVSTTYSNTNRNPIYEVMYPPLADWRDTLAVCDTLDEHTVRVLTSKYLGELPNTYTFTKQLGDHLVYEHKGKLPIVIVRPSIVVSSKEEPFPGWVDSFNGPIGLFVASGKGIINSVYAEPNLLSDYIPVDISIRNIVAAAWIRGTKKLEATDDIPIYNSCSGNLKHYYLEGLVEMAKHITVSIPFDNIIWVPNGSLTAYKSIHYIKIIFLHLLPSLLIDGILLLSNKKPMLVKIQRRIYIANLAIQYFLTMQWTFDNKNTLTLRSCIKEVDKKAFFYDIENLDIYNFMCNSVYGVKKYLLKEKDEDLPKAKRDYRRLYVLHIIVRFLFYGFIFWKLFNTAFVQGLIEGCFSLFDF